MALGVGANQSLFGKIKWVGTRLSARISGKRGTYRARGAKVFSAKYAAVGERVGKKKLFQPDTQISRKKNPFPRTGSTADLQLSQIPGRGMNRREGGIKLLTD